MKTNETNLQSAVAEISEATLESSVSVRAYYEMENQPVIEMTDLEVLQNQLQQIQQLQQRSRFMMREIAYLLKID